MNLPPLPDELRNWPDDPFAVLGIDRAGDKKAARRAYAARVREYKPEEAPDKFQRVREAYESVLQYIEWGFHGEAMIFLEDQDGSLRPWDPTADETSYAADLFSDEHPPQADAQSPSGPRGVDRLFQRDVADECRDRWQQAVAGEGELAYAGLQDCRLREPRLAEIATRLYWLLKLCPELDTDRRPINWLYDGVRTCGLTEHLPELLRRQLAKDPSEASRPECWQAIESCGTSPDLCDLCGWRWQALGLLQRTALIRDDLERLRPRLANADPQLWCQVLLRGLDHLAWSHDQKIARVFPEYVEEAERAGLAGVALHESLTRLDLLVDAAHGWRELLHDGKTPKRWTQIVPMVWTLPAEQVRPLLVPLLKEMALSPEVGLERFDHMVARSPAAAFQLGTAIEDWYFESHSFADLSWDEESLGPVAEDFVARYGRFGYHVGRQRLLDLCLEDSIDPQQFAALLASKGWLAGMSCAELADEINRDGGLRYIYLAARVFLG